MGDPENRRGQTQRLPDRDAPGHTGRSSQTRRYDPDEGEWVERAPADPHWRRERSSGRRRQARGLLPASPQELQLWLQAGGWRYLAGIALLVIVLLIALLALGRTEQRESGLGFREPTAAPVTTPVPGGVLSGEPYPSPMAETSVAAPAGRRFYIVSGTGGQGLFLRPDPSTAGAPITTLPEGTRVEALGEEVPGGDYLWRKVRAPDGREGYVAADFLVEAP
ncbi:MAG: SH3 domain-containing protein [Oscillochloridaceae bacterium]|nr:SH3 domain-containing protein [Chloroflexaceae bacterium]MDW8388866.1 SH3 domain-containing protein [Oscillochloridaceae bacterium]